MRLTSVLIIVAISCFGRAGFAEQLVVPIVESEGKIYLGAEFTRVDKSSLGDKFTSATKVGEQFIQLIKGASRSDASLFSSRDGSDVKWLDPEEYSRYAGFKKIDSIEYNKNPIAWGEYLHMPTNYTVGKKDLQWREDYLCSNGECKKSLYDFGQLFEVAYKYYVKGTNGQKLGDVASMMAAKGNSEVFDLANTLPTDQAGPAFKVGITLASIEGSDCVLCEKEQYANEFDKALLGNVRDFVRNIQELNVYDEEQMQSAWTKYASILNPQLGVPKVNWKSASPELIHTDTVGYIREWQRYSEGRLEGYMLDDDFAYLFASRTISPVGSDDEQSTKSNQEQKQFQIFALKKNASGRYDLFPHTDKQLESRALVFDRSTLSLFSELLGASI